MINSFLQHGKEMFLYKKEWKILLLLMLFDALLLSALFAAATLFDAVMAQYEYALVGTWKGYILLFVYFLIVTLAYSFFKYCSLGFLTKENSDKGVSFDRFWKFYLWTLCVCGISLLLFGIIFLFFSYGLISILKSPALIIFSVAYWTIIYLYIQTSHVLFFLEKKLTLKELTTRSWTTLQWNWLWKWGALNIIFLTFFFAIYFVLYMLLILIGKNAVQSMYGLFYLFNLIILVFLVSASYFLLFWNRISVFVFVNKRKNTKCQEPPVKDWWHDAKASLLNRYTGGS